MDFAQLAVVLPVLLMSIVVHEVAHAWQARREGDSTADRLGRITLNPIKHIDPVGSIVVPLLLWFTNAGFLFGWAKPVPVVPANYREYKWGDIRVSLAGIVANIGLAILSMFFVIAVVKTEPLFGSLLPDQFWVMVQQMAYYGIVINLVLAIFNLFPIPPLDGSHVLYHMLPPELGAKYRELGRYGIFIVMAVLFLVPGAFNIVFWPVEYLRDLAYAFIGLWI